jgi:uncharacterized protein YycO
MSYKVYEAGTEPPKFVPGDFILVSTKGVLAKCIRTGQFLRYHGKMRAYSHWNHAAMIVDTDGTIVEAAGRGVRYANISEYKETEYYLVSTKLNKQSRDQAVAAAKSFIKDKYGWFTILSIMLQLITGIEFQFSFGNSIICSGVVGMALWAAGVIFDQNPYQMMPADLASAYEINCTTSN